MRHVRDFAAAALLLLLELVLYRKILRLWWVYDDSSLFRIILETRPLEAWTSARVWPQQLFTPLMMSAFEAQYALFGLDAHRWYIVFLAIIAITSIAIYAAARQYLEVPYALAGTTLFLLGTPLCSLVTQLSTVHYFIALTFGSLALIAWSKRLDALSAVLFFVAILAKEIIVPLPLLLLFLPPRRELRRLITHAIALVVYFAWRRAVIGTFLGAYSWIIGRDEWPRLALLLPWKVIKAAAGPHLAIGLVLLAVMAIVIAARIRNYPLLLVALAVAIGPILPVSKDLHPRYIVAFWLAWSFAFAAARPHWAFLVAVPLLAIVVNRQEWGKEIVLRQRMSAEAEFYLQMASDDLLRLPATPPPVMREWNVIKTHLGMPPSGPYFYDDFYLCVNDVSGRDVWEYDPRQRIIINVSARIPTIAKNHCSSMRNAAPLSARFHFGHSEMHWDFGPYASGRYSILLGDGHEAWVMPRQDALNLPVVHALAVRVRYESPQGWTTYSPVIEIDDQRKCDVAWRRGTDK